MPAATGTPSYVRRAVPVVLAAALALGAAPAQAQTAPTPAPTQAPAPQPTTVTIGVSQAAGTYTFTGAVTPAVAGVQVTIARLGTDGRVTGIASTRTVTGGRYEIRTSLPLGFASYYALTAATPEVPAGRSRLYGLIVNVLPGGAVTPTVSLHARHSSGARYVFSGQVSPARSVPATLARNVGGRLIGVVGARTGPSGTYAFGVDLGPGTHSFQVLTGAANGLTSASSRVYGLVVPGATAGRPAAVSPVLHGGTYFGVYLALGNGSADPRLAAADASARRLGYTPGRTSLGCDLGAARGLGRPATSQEHATVLYFRTEAEARQFAALHPPVEAGVVRVQTFCRDEAALRPGAESARWVGCSACRS
jgi:hypothetical protein